MYGLFVLCLPVLFARAARAADATTFAVGPDGGLTVKVGTAAVANGTWALQGTTAAAADELPLGDAKVAVAPGATAARAVVTHTYPAFEATYTYTAVGDDLRIAAHLVNRDPARTLRRVAFYGPTFHFARRPDGSLHSWHYTYLAAQGLAVYHPSVQNPVGCVFEADDRFGVAMHSDSEFSRQDLFNGSWRDDDGAPPECHVEFYTTRTVPPGGAVDVDVNFRVSADRSVPHLLAAYKRTYADHFPVLLYTPDSRPLGEFAGIDKSFVTPTDPLGYDGDWRRLDTELGTARYVRSVAPPLAAGNAAGIIFWSPGGARPPLYPPDFDDFPPAVQRNLPALIRGFHDHHLRVGLCARCGDGIRRPPGKPAEVYRIAAENPAQMAEMLGRFRRAIEMGFDLFYLDSIGATDLNDVAILQQVRAAVGPDVLLYSEFGTDMTLPVAGRYNEWLGTQLRWTGPAQLASQRFLCPESTWAVLSRTNDPVPKAVLDLGLTPMVLDINAGRLPKAVGRP